MYSRESIKQLDAIPISRFFPHAINKGNKYYCKCPSCGAEGMKKSKMQGLQITVDEIKGTNIGKCFQCGFALRGALNAYAFIHNLDAKRDFVTIIKNFADEISFKLVEESTVENEFTGKPIPGSFTYRQLKESGLTPSDVLAEVYEGDRLIKAYPFLKGSLKVNTGEVNFFDDEMIIAYYDLEGRRKTYMPLGARASSKSRNYSRIRWSNPEAKKDKFGKPVKYQTPVGAKAEIYIPQKIRDAYKSRSQFETLFIQEGEKKAEKACKHGIMSVGIQGIYNIGRKDDGLPQEIQYLVQRCGIKNIILLFDSDWQDLSRNLAQDDDVDSRPRQFAKAAIKFKNFVKTLHQSKLHVDIWFGHINKNNADAKGIDDLLCGPLEGRESVILEDIKNAMININGIAEYVSLHNISTISDYQVLDYWNLNSKKEFFDIHKERLLELKSFRFGKVFYNVINGEFRQASELGSGREFWDVSYSEKGEKKINISIIDAKAFLEANGFRSHVDEEGYNTFVRIDKGIILKIRIPDIHRFVFNYVTKASKDKDVHEYFANIMESKLTQGKLNLLDPLLTNAGIPEQYVQRFYYRNSQITINENGITTEPLTGPVWDQNLIKREFSRIKIFENVEKVQDDFNIVLTEEGEECEFLKFLKNTSSFQIEDGKEELDNNHLINKLTCIGYLLRDYRSYVETKAVVGMDTRMSEVGDSNGRSGKSLIGMAIAKMINQITISGRNLKDSDEFIFSEVRNTSRNIFIDDIKVNFNIGNIYSDITGDMTVNVKQGRRFTIPFAAAPKIYITTNHSIKSEGDSTDARIIFMGFSPHYSKKFTPVMEFGHQFFTDWDDRQWALFDNLMAECVMLYMKSIQLGWAAQECGAVPPPMDSINRRRERQIMGEAFFQWAEGYFANDGNFINTRIYRLDMFNQFHKDVPGQHKFVTSTNFKTKLKAYCEFKGLHLNPHRKHETLLIQFDEWKKINPKGSFFGKEEKSGGKEYFTVSNEDYLIGSKNSEPF